MNLLGFGTKDAKFSILKDPFKKDNIKEVWIYNTYGEWKGHIHFKNGNSEGTQRFTGYKSEDFQKLLTDMQKFAESI